MNIWLEYTSEDEEDGDDGDDDDLTKTRTSEILKT